MSSDMKVIKFTLNNKEFCLLYTTLKIIKMIKSVVYKGWAYSMQESDTE